MSNKVGEDFDSNGKYDSLDDVIKDARVQMKAFMDFNQIPGAVMAFSINGTNVWTEGFGYTDIENNVSTHKDSVWRFGYTDIENNVSTHKDSVWRLASISKSLTSALVGQLMDRHLIDLNAEIHKYLSKDFYPFKTFNGSAVNITVREVMSHTAGLHMSDYPEDFDKYLIRRADNVSHNIKPFKDEPLLSKPGTEFSYSNYGFQMVGAIIESILHNTYENEIKKMFTQLHMNSTFAERREMIVKHRPQYYQLSNQTSGTLQKSDIIDELISYEGSWPAGGIISTADNMLRTGVVDTGNHWQN
ncbi:unnamed protein product [Oppiella nova]|uniref:Beta-lactamase-related domain-containing protein n=1 Tax=Oppiella nova TaxID=334625 RepID=A0A7R9M7J0_9ACAR|nr:unnamed protein product [Oppiella nova]CAG2172218.1 unnamed protein product [Oppiella nova]